MKALSIRQPWANLILAGTKKYEFRTRVTHFRGLFAVHAAKTVDHDAFYTPKIQAGSLVTAAVLGTVQLVDCQRYTRELADKMRAAGDDYGEWYDGLYAWELAKPSLLARPIPWKGRLGFFDVPDDLFQPSSRAVSTTGTIESY